MIAAFIFASAAHAQPVMMDQEPDHALDCVFQHPERADIRQRVTLFLFDEPMTADRFSSVSGLEKIEGITVVSEVFDSSDAVTMYNFGTFSETPQAFELAFDFASRITSSGLTIVEMADRYVVDRMAGTMKAVTDNPNAGFYECGKFAGSFSGTATAYHERVVDAVGQFEAKQKF